ncbi:MAG: hypothetical protein JWO03_3696 [Bacteroidetes bacterium]|nr:hypothetical protein [Bacteroidota bacterium]
MKEYILIFRIKPLTPEEFELVRVKWATIIPRWTEQGHFVHSSLMHNEGIVISGPERNITEAPMANGERIVLSFLRLKADNQDQAMKLAMEAPTLDAGGSVEVREVKPITPPAITNDANAARN